MTNEELFKLNQDRIARGQPIICFGRSVEIKLSATPQRTSKPRMSLREATRRVAARELLQRKELTTMAYDHRNSIPGANTDADPQAEQKLQAIAKVLGVEPTSTDVIAQAFNALIASNDASPDPDAKDARVEDPKQVAARRQLTPEQLEICRKTGCSPANFLAAKKVHGAKDNAALRSALNTDAREAGAARLGWVKE